MDIRPLPLCQMASVELRLGGYWVHNQLPVVLATTRAEPTTERSLLTFDARAGIRAAHATARKAAMSAYSIRS